MKRLILIVVGCVFLLSSAAMAAGIDNEPFTLSSPSFGDGKWMPSKHKYYAEDKSPALVWKNAPEGTKSFVITCIDYDARSVVGVNRPWLHWQIYNIPASFEGLPEGIPLGKAWKDGIIQSKNDSGAYGWTGPYPPNGPHKYDFVINALDVPILESTKSDYIKKHTLATAKLVGVSDR